MLIVNNHQGLVWCRNFLLPMNHWCMEILGIITSKVETMRHSAPKTTPTDLAQGHYINPLLLFLKHTHVTSVTVSFYFINHYRLYTISPYNCSVQSINTTLTSYQKLSPLKLALFSSKYLQVHNVASHTYPPTCSLLNQNYSSTDTWGGCHPLRSTVFWRSGNSPYSPVEESRAIQDVQIHCLKVVTSCHDNWFHEQCKKKKKK